ncbi:sodium:solute symporter family protein [Acidaminobacter hydrogenoformans]|uniref:Solute:Na+ symporter, SSS family n=1 Tax=Acidaminobacter hydrogenoformans DSM 2784 TaxID=1120920 RepID=A0A1G5S0A8_9FIRM|nr:sodium:solute symporter family protein [Acidaminobacter hydrogenoformans]SCZ79835.1 solute:Na+ symporter, SSS family [Acidaminobacter hydrogenoformans DSM 2784]
MTMELSHYIGAAIVLAIMTLGGIYSGRQIKSSRDFTSGGRRAGSGIVAGTIIGTLVGGASTIGTAQLAFTDGFSAWWFTLGNGIGCLILGLFYAKPLYQSGLVTLPQLISAEFGRKAATMAAVLTSLGSFLSIISQFLSGIALITALSSLGPMGASALVLMLMMAYVIFGGVWGTGIVGVLKALLMYAGVGLSGIMAIRVAGGLEAFQTALPAAQYFNLLSHGLTKNMGSVVSVVVGVVTGQVYIQAIIAAKSLKTSRQGAWISMALIPLIGLAGIYVGMFMRIHAPQMDPVYALPVFVLTYLPPVLAGGILATLLVTLVGSGAGMALGISAMVGQDLYKVYVSPEASDRSMLFVTRLIIFVVLALSAAVTIGNLGSGILGWSFVSMGLRGTVAFAPLCAALFMPGKVGRSYAYAAMIAGPLLMLLSRWSLPPNIDPILLGISGPILIMLAGRLRRNHHAL